MGEIRKLDNKGDSKFTWDKDNEEETEAAEEYFNDLTARKFVAYFVKKNGDRSEDVMKKFDPEAGMIIMVPNIGGG